MLTRLLALIFAGSIALIAPAIAHANGSVAYAAHTLTVFGDQNADDNLSISLNAAATTYTITDTRMISNLSAACTVATGNHTITCTADGPGDDTINLQGAGGNDTLTVDTSAAPGPSQPDTVNVRNDVLAPGNDTIDLSKYTRPDERSTIVGGPGDDTEIAAPGGTTFDMGDAEDGSDTLVGGPGFDDADYGGRTADLTLNAADGLADDGQAGEHDDISADVEELDGGSGTNTITAGPHDSRLTTGGANSTLIGGPGSDELDGGSGNTVLKGGAGDDEIFTRSGSNNTIDGGPGDDSIDLGGGVDDVHGGDGIDFVQAFGEIEISPISPPPGVFVTLDDLANDGASGEGSNIHSDVEDIETGGGNDTVVGSDASNNIFTDFGNDLVTAGGGSDFVSTGAGDDGVSARDGIFDRVSCGDGIDSATVDSIDQLSGCENVSSAPVAPPPGDTQPAHLTIAGLARRLSRRAFLKNGISLRVAPSEPVRLIYTLTRHVHGGDLVVATKSFGTTGSPRTVRLKAARRVSVRRFTLRLEVLAVDNGGNLTKVRRTIAIR